jgi:hypothetical protein
LLAACSGINQPLQALIPICCSVRTGHRLVCVHQNPNMPSNKFQLVTARLTLLCLDRIYVFGPVTSFSSPLPGQHYRFLIA